MILVIVLLLLALATGVLGFVVKWAFILAVVFLIGTLVGLTMARELGRPAPYDLSFAEEPGDGKTP